MTAAKRGADAESELVRRIPTRIVAGSLYAVATVAIAAVAAWPIYRSDSYVLLVAVATVVGAAIAVVAQWRGWSGWSAAAVLAAAVAVLGVPLAVPSRLGGPLEVLRGLGEVGTGVALAWKDLVTVDLPVGSYRNLLVPALVVFLVGTCAVVRLSWRDSRLAYLAVPVGFAMTSFGLLFGRTATSATLQLGPFALHAPLETAIGVGALLAALLWLAWRSRDERVRALRRAAASSGVRISRRPSGADRRRVALGAGMLVVAVAVAVAVVPFAAQGADRQVLRSATGPDIDISAAASPLAGYRAQFADDRAEEVLFTVSGDGALPARIRVATLDSYDGVVYRSGGAGSGSDARFIRVPSTIDAGTGAGVDVDVAIGALDGIWMPTAGRIASVSFHGPRAASLADGFYYSVAAQAGVETADGGLASGDEYSLRAVVADTPALGSIEAPGGLAVDGPKPEHLERWVESHVTGTGGAALDGLVRLLRERGYLSHALDAGDGTPVWASSLPGYVFQPSTAGHSLARIDGMFARLLDREADPRAAATGNFVAAIGDDEQFAVAAALIARELGFPSRVVLGARLSSDDAGLPVCAEGVCRADDLAVWTEVQSSAGEWVPFDATPQYAQSPSLEVTEQRDPENVTEVRPDSVTEVLPPDPVQQDAVTGDGDDDRGALDLAWLWPVLRIVAIVLLSLLIVLGPFAAVAFAKLARRHSRRREGDPAARIAGGWEEYVDAAVDAGRDAPASLTRRELAEAFDSHAGLELAARADRAIFAGASVRPEDAEDYWKAVDEQRRGFTRGRGVWKKLVATVSLRSFFRHLVPAPGRRAGQRIVERGKRAAAGLAQTTP